jgi:hypothetical protein
LSTVVKHPFIDQLTIARIHLTDAQRERGLNFIQTYASEFIQQYEWYLQENRPGNNDSFNDIKLQGVGMKKSLKSSTVYEPNNNVKVTVVNTPILDDENVEVGTKATVTLKVTAFEKITFNSDDDIAEWFGAVDFTDPQLDMFSNGDVPAPDES